MTERETKLKISVDDSDINKTRLSAEKMQGALRGKETVDGFKEMAFHLRGIGKLVGALGDDFRKFNEQVGKSKDAHAFKGMADDIKAMTQAMHDFTAAKKKSADEDEKHAQRRGFGMGVLQGAGVGEYFPEKGMVGNVLGRGAGRMARAAVMTPLGGMFSGAAGVQEGLAGIPGVGGMLAGGLAAGLGAAQQAIMFEAQKGAALQFQQLQAIRGVTVNPGSPAQYIPPYGGFTTVTTPSTNGFNANSVIGSVMAKLNSGVSDALDAVGDLDANAAAITNASMSVNPRLRNNPNRGIMAFGAPGPGQQGTTIPAVPASTTGGNAAQWNLGALYNQGVEFGRDKTEAFALMTRALGSAGGTSQQFGDATHAREMLMLDRFGVGADAYGGFMRNEREFGRSGIGAASRAWQAAQGLDLQGSDRTDYMEQIARLLGDSARQGIKIDDDSQNGLARKFALTGVGGERGGDIAFGLGRTARGMSQSGPQNAAQFQMLRTLYGYKGGGLEDYATALRRAERNEVVPGGYDAFMKPIQDYQGGPNSKAFHAMQIMRAYGAPVSFRTGESLASGNIGPRMKAALNRVALGLDQTANLTPGTERLAAETRNKKLDAGVPLMGAALALEDAQANAVKSVKAFARAITTASDLILQASALLPGAMQHAAQVINQTMSVVGP